MATGRVLMSLTRCHSHLNGGIRRAIRISSIFNWSSSACSFHLFVCSFCQAILHFRCLISSWSPCRVPRPSTLRERVLLVCDAPVGFFAVSSNPAQTPFCVCCGSFQRMSHKGSLHLLDLSIHSSRHWSKVVMASLLLHSGPNASSTWSIRSLESHAMVCAGWKLSETLQVSMSKSENQRSTPCSVAS